MPGTLFQSYLSFLIILEHSIVHYFFSFKKKTKQNAKKLDGLGYNFFLLKYKSQFWETENVFITFKNCPQGSGLTSNCSTSNPAFC